MLGDFSKGILNIYIYNILISTSSIYRKKTSEFG